MPLYTRVDFEDDIANIEALEIRTTRALVKGKITGFDFNTTRDLLEKLRQTCEGKLRFTGVLIRENKDVARETKNCAAGGHKQGACKIALCACACGHKWRRGKK